MKRKPIGEFIKELREAEGMSLREFAERLSVSEKTVKDWERDITSPDIMALPAIAELFDISCDELIRGERIISEESKAHLIEKNEREKTRIITTAVTQFGNHSIVSGAFLVLGVVSAFILTTSFHRVKAAFFTAMGFYIIAVLYQSIIMNNSFAWMRTCDLDSERLGYFKKSVIRDSEWVFGITCILIGFTAPVLMEDIEWIFSAPLCATLAFLIFRSTLSVIRMIMVRKGIYTLSASERAVMKGNMELKKVSIMCLVTMLLATALLNVVLTRPEVFMDHVIFNDYESFEKFMETPPEGHEMAPKAYRIRDKNGNVLLEYIQRRDDVQKVSYELLYGDALPIFVWTDSEYNEALEKVQIVKRIFAALYLVESVGTLIGYVITRNRYHLEENI